MRRLLVLGIPGETLQLGGGGGADNAPQVAHHHHHALVSPLRADARRNRHTTPGLASDDVKQEALASRGVVSQGESARRIRMLETNGTV